MTLRPPAGCAAKLRYIPRRIPGRAWPLQPPHFGVRGFFLPVPGSSVMITSWSPARYCRTAIASPCCGCARLFCESLPGPRDDHAALPAAWRPGLVSLCARELQGLRGPQAARRDSRSRTGGLLLPKQALFR